MLVDSPRNAKDNSFCSVGNIQSMFPLNKGMIETLVCKVFIGLVSIIPKRVLMVLWHPPYTHHQNANKHLCCFV